MNNDYLWDRTGEPDPEVQELEEVLGTLRYQPRSLELPAEILPAPRRRFFPTLAIAAMIALTVLAAGLWLRLHRQLISNPAPGDKLASASPIPGRTTQSDQPGGTNTTVSRSNGTENGKETIKIGGPPEQAPSPGKRPGPAELPAPKRPAPRRYPAPLPDANANEALTARNNADTLDPAEGEAAKEQLMLALRITSSKLNHAQRKTMGLPTTNNIRNQHKLG